MTSVELPLKRLVIFSLRSASTFKSCLFSVDRDSVNKRYQINTNQLLKNILNNSFLDTKLCNTFKYIIIKLPNTDCESYGPNNLHFYISSVFCHLMMIIQFLVQWCFFYQNLELWKFCFMESTIIP